MFKVTDILENVKPEHKDLMREIVSEFGQYNEDSIVDSDTYTNIITTYMERINNA